MVTIDKILASELKMYLLFSLIKETARDDDSWLEFSARARLEVL